MQSLYTPFKVSKFLVYGLVDPRNGELRYIGKSSAGLKRPSRHRLPIGRKGRTHNDNWLRQLWNDGNLVPCIVVLRECNSNVEALAQEIFLIALFREAGFNLTNITAGGEGAGGYERTEEHRKNLSKALMGHVLSEETKKKIGHANKNLTPEQKETISKSRIGNKNCVGRTYTEEQKQRFREINLGRKPTEEARAKMRLAAEKRRLNKA